MFVDSAEAFYWLFLGDYDLRKLVGVLSLVSHLGLYRGILTGTVNPAMLTKKTTISSSLDALLHNDCHKLSWSWLSEGKVVRKCHGRKNLQIEQVSKYNNEDNSSPANTRSAPSLN